MPVLLRSTSEARQGEGSKIGKAGRIRKEGAFNTKNWALAELRTFWPIALA